MTAIGFPKTRAQFSLFRASTAVQPTATRGSSQDIGDIGATTADRGMYGDATLTILTNKNNPIVEVRFQDVYPVSLGALSYDQAAADVQYLSVTADFDYKIYDIVTL